MLSSRTESGKNTYYVSDSTELFEENANIFLNTPFREKFSAAV